MMDVREAKRAFCGDPKSRVSCIEECRGLTEDRLTLFKQLIRKVKSYMKVYMHKPKDHIKAGGKISTVFQKYSGKRVFRRCGVVE